MDIKQIFDDNLELAREEYPKESLAKHLSIAQSQTLNEVEVYVARLYEQQWALYLDNVNKAFFE